MSQELETFMHTLPLHLWARTASRKAIEYMLTSCKGTCTDRIILGLLSRKPFDDTLVSLVYKENQVSEETNLLVKSVLTQPDILADEKWLEIYNQALINHTHVSFHSRLIHRFSPLRMCSHPNFITYVKQIRPLFCEIRLFYCIGKDPTCQAMRKIVQRYPKNSKEISWSPTSLKSVSAYGFPVITDGKINLDLFTRLLQNMTSFPCGPYTLILVLFDVLHYGHDGYDQFVDSVEAWQQTVSATVEFHRT